MLDVRGSRAPSTPARSVASAAARSVASTTPTTTMSPPSSVKAPLDDNEHATMDRFKTKSIAKLNHKYDVSHEDSCVKRQSCKRMETSWGPRARAFFLNPEVQELSERDIDARLRRLCEVKAKSRLANVEPWIQDEYRSCTSGMLCGSPSLRL